jgi:hypothetical protein
MLHISKLAKIFAGGLLLSLASNTHATLITSTDIITDWTSGGSPVDNVIAGSWIDASGTVQGTGNHAGSLVSDVIANSNFSFSASSTARDNDTFGLIWGFQDLSNHYRLSWAQDYGETGVGVAPVQGFGGIFDGFKIIKEIAGTSSVLFSSEIEYVQNQNYSMSVSGTATGFNVMINNLTTSTLIFNESIGDTAFTTGKVGIHELYQNNGNSWSEIDLNLGSTSVPEPTSLAVMATGLLMLGLRRRKIKVSKD